MICEKCGKPVDDDAESCDYCGADVTKMKLTQTEDNDISQNDIHTTDTKEKNDKEKKSFFSKKRNVIILIIIAAAVILGGVLAIILIPDEKPTDEEKKKPEKHYDTIYLDDYFSIEFSGKDGIGTVSIIWDDEAVATLDEKYFKKVPDIGSNMVKGMLKYSPAKLRELIDVKIEKSEDISNGEELTVSVVTAGDQIYGETFNTVKKIQNGYSVKFKLRNSKIIADGLTYVQKINIFDDISVTFTGIDSEGKANIAPSVKKRELESGGYVKYSVGNLETSPCLTVDFSDKKGKFVSSVSFFFDSDGELSNGDTVKLMTEAYSHEVRKGTAETLNAVIELTEMEYTVSGLEIEEQP